ncbi:MAG: MFS transporter [Paenibacillaceae bacterium]|nr:MFS transporter [Paenibacillaceae bacterium]
MSKYTVLFFLIMFMIGTDTFLISPLLPTLQEQFGVPTGIAGWMLGAYALGSALFALVAGPLSDGLNRRTVLLGGLLAFAVATALCGLANSFWTMCLFRFLAGIGAAFTAPQVWASIPSVVPGPRIARTMGIAFAGLAASQACGVPIGSWLATASWQVPFWAIGAASLLLAVLAYTILPDMKPDTKPESSKAERASLFRRYIPLIASGQARGGFIAYLLLHLGVGAAFAFAGRWLADGFALPVGQIGNVMIFLGLGNLFGSAAGSYAVRLLGSQPRVIVAGLLAAAGLYAAMPHLHHIAAATAVYFLICVTLGAVFPLVMGLLTALNASIRGTISSLANATMNGANTLGAWAAGLLYVQFGGYSPIGLFAAACLALSLAAFLRSGMLRADAQKQPLRSAGAAE